MFFDAGVTYRARVGAGVCNAGGRCVTQPVAWQFQIPAGGPPVPGDTRVPLGFPIDPGHTTDRHR